MKKESNAKALLPILVFLVFYLGLGILGVNVFIVLLNGIVSGSVIMPNLFYPYLLLVSSLLFIFVIPDKKQSSKARPKKQSC